MGEIPSHSQAILHRFALRRLFNFLSLSPYSYSLFIWLMLWLLLIAQHNWQKKKAQLSAHLKRFIKRGGWR